jgi:hypothetical protein
MEIYWLRNRGRRASSELCDFEDCAQDLLVYLRDREWAEVSGIGWDILSRLAISI